MHRAVHPPATLAVLAACGGAPPTRHPGDPAPLLACWRNALGGRARLASRRGSTRRCCPGCSTHRASRPARAFPGSRRRSCCPPGLHDPAAFQPPADAIALPFYTYDTKPMIETRFELADGRSFAA